MTPYGIVRIDGIEWQVIGTVNFQDLGTFDRKFVSGDYTKDSDDLISALILGDFTGGLGIEVARQGSDDGRYNFGNLGAQEPGTLILSRRINTYTYTGVSRSSPGGDIAGNFYGVFDTSVRLWQEPTNEPATGTGFATTPVATLVSHPVNDSVVFQGTATSPRLWFPLGASGLQGFDGSATLSTVAPATVSPVALVKWDNALWALSVDGSFKKSLDGTTWTTLTPPLSIDPSERPMDMIVFRDRNGAPTIHIVSSAGVYAYSSSDAKLYETDLRYPPHPDGQIALKHQDYMAVAMGLEIYRYTGSTISTFSPRRDYGLPETYRGRIVDLCSEHNGVLALVRGTTVPGASPLRTEDPGLSAEDGARFPNNPAYGSLLLWTGIGWHAIHTSRFAGGEPTRIRVSTSAAGTDANGYRVWWGQGDSLRTIILPRDFHQPRQGARLGVDLFQPDGYIETAWYDHGMTTFEKIASSVIINAEIATLTEKITLSYQTDYDTDWKLLGVVTTVGSTEFGFGVAMPIPPTEGGGSAGVRYRRIRFRIEMARNPLTPYTSPVMDSLVLKHLRIPLSSRSWSFETPLETKGTEGYGGITNQERFDLLREYLTNGEFLTLEHQNRTYRIRVSQVRGPDHSGPDPSGSRQIVLVEVPYGREFDIIGDFVA